MSKLIRVHDTTTGHRYTITDSQLTEQLIKVDDPAVDLDGNPLPPTHNQPEPNRQPDQADQSKRPAPPKPALPAISKEN